MVGTEFFSIGLAGIPPDVVERARVLILDLLGVAASGIVTPVSRIARDHAARHMGAGGRGAAMLFDGRPVSAAGMAFAGATTIDSYDAHDGHVLTKGHAGVTVLPAALAFAQATGRLDGGELLASVVMGYEVAIRAGIALHAEAADYHTSGAWNALAAAAIGARYLGLDAGRARHAVGIAEFHGPRSQMMRCIDHPTMVKDGSGWGAFAGVTAAFLAQDGFTGAPAVTMEDARHRALWSDLGVRWRIMEQYIKPYPVCRWAQAPLEAVLHLTAGAAIRPDEIARVVIRTFHEAVRLGTSMPGDTEAAQYALGFPLAAMLVRGRLGASEIAGDALRDPAIAALLSRVDAVEDPAIDADFPASRSAIVELHLVDGRVLASPRTYTRGDPDSPLPEAEFAAKMEGALGDRARAVRDGVAALSAGGAVGPLLDAVLPPL